MKYLIVLSIIFNTHFSFATECKESVQLIEAGQKAQCTGFLFSPDAERQASEAVLDLKYYKEINLKLLERKELAEQDYAIMENRMMLYQDQSVLLADKLNSAERYNKWDNMLWFGLGILATSLAVYGASSLAK